jgi:hypothetical protein
MPNWGAVVGVAPIGVIACGAALHGADQPVWPALPVGVLGAGLAAAVSRDVATGAVRRQQAEMTDPQAQTPSGVVVIVVLAAVAVAALSLVAQPVGAVAFLGLAWLGVSRRRREERKHEGLRVLR